MTASTITLFGKDQDQNRDLYLVEAHRPEHVELPHLSSGRFFTGLIVWNADDVPEQSILQFAQRMIDAGAVYFCVWGRGCERIHDLIDRVWVGDGFDPASDDTVMTTWHDHEPLNEAIWFSVNVAFPTDAFFEECRSVVAICIDCPSLAQEVCRAFTNAKKFHVEMLDPD